MVCQYHSEGIAKRQTGGWGAPESRFLLPVSGKVTKLKKEELSALTALFQMRLEQNDLR
jgi:hypothetical protein